MIARFISHLRARWMPDRAAGYIQRQIRTARAKHEPTAHLKAALTELRHAQLRATR